MVLGETFKKKEEPGKKADRADHSRMDNMDNEKTGKGENRSSQNGQKSSEAKFRKKQITADSANQEK